MTESLRLSQIEGQMGALVEMHVTLRDDVKQMKDILERQVRLEERYALNSEALERAFRSISDVKKDVDKLEEAQQFQAGAAGTWKRVVSIVGIFASCVIGTIGWALGDQLAALKVLPTQMQLMQNRLQLLESLSIVHKETPREK